MSLSIRQGVVTRHVGRKRLHGAAKLNRARDTDEALNRRSADVRRGIRPNQSMCIDELPRHQNTRKEKSDINRMEKIPLSGLLPQENKKQKTKKKKPKEKHF